MYIHKTSKSANPQKLFYYYYNITDMLAIYEALTSKRILRNFEQKVFTVNQSSTVTKKTTRFGPLHNKDVPFSRLSSRSILDHLIRIKLTKAKLQN